MKGCLISIEDESDARVEVRMPWPHWWHRMHLGDVLTILGRDYRVVFIDVDDGILQVERARWWHKWRLWMKLPRRLRLAIAARRVAHARAVAARRWLSR